MIPGDAILRLKSAIDDLEQGRSELRSMLESLIREKCIECIDRRSCWGSTYSQLLPLTGDEGTWVCANFRARPCRSQ